MSVEPDPWWTVLTDVLGSLGVVEARDPYGLVVSAQRADGTPAVVEIVMTREEWGDLVSMWWVVVESAADHVRGLVLNQPEDQRFLVYSYYQLLPCDAPELPVDPGLLRLREIAAQYPDGIIPGGAGTPTHARTRSCDSYGSAAERAPATPGRAPDESADQLLTRCGAIRTFQTQYASQAHAAKASSKV